MRPHQKPHVLAPIAIALTVATTTTSALAQQDCLEFVFDTPAPPVTQIYLPVYDSERGVYVAFGNAGEIFEWHGAWILLGIHPYVFEVNRRGAAVFDSLRGRSLILDMGHFDTFSAWDGTSLTPLPPLPNDDLVEASMIFDSARDRVVVFGGSRLLDQADVTDETWEFDGVEWTLIEPPVRPPARQAAVMSYDSVRGVAVMFGGRVGGEGFATLYTDTWEWDGAEWTERTIEVGVNPPGGSYFDSLAMTYDPARERTFLVHNAGLPGDPDVFTYWEWDGSTWSARHATGTAGPQAIVFDTTEQKIRAGGFGVYSVYLLETPEPPIVTQSPTSASVTSGQPVLFTVEATEGDPGLGELAYQWRLNGVPIPAATLPTYAIGSATPADQGAYDCLVSYDGFFSDCGTALSEAATLTVGSTCPGDANGDGNVDVLDLIEVIAGWGLCP